MEGDRDRTIMAMVVARAWRDDAYRQQLLSDPKAVLTEEGLELPGDVAVRVVEDTPSVKYVNVSRDADEAEPEQLSGLLRVLLPIPKDHELRLVQSTEGLRYVVLPTLPAGAQPASMSEPELMRLAADSGVEATYHDTSQTVEAETTEAVVTETTEAQDVETSTTVVAEAELVAT